MNTIEEMCAYALAVTAVCAAEKEDADARASHTEAEAKLNTHEDSASETREREASCKSRLAYTWCQELGRLRFAEMMARRREARAHDRLLNIQGMALALEEGCPSIFEGFREKFAANTSAEEDFNARILFEKANKE